MDPKMTAGLIAFIIIFPLEYFLPHYAGRKSHIRHSAFNLSMVVINGILGRFLFLGINLWLFHFIGDNRFGLMQISSIPYPVRFFSALVLFDIWMYFWHMANHRLPFLWLFHSAHHNDTEMDSSTSLRLHPVEIIFSSLVRLPVYLIIGMDMAVLAVYESILMVSILFHHSNISLPAKADLFLSYFIVTPDMHRTHHSINYNEVNSNYSSIISIWDRLFGTFKKWRDTKALTLGLQAFRGPEWQTPWGILAVPFQPGNKNKNTGGIL